MRAFSEKKYATPQVQDDAVVLRSKTDNLEVRSYVGIKYIRQDNTVETYHPRLMQAGTSQ